MKDEINRLRALQKTQLHRFDDGMEDELRQYKDIPNKLFRKRLKNQILKAGK
jgi:hypothetical protein